MRTRPAIVGSGIEPTRFTSRLHAERSLVGDDPHRLRSTNVSSVTSQMGSISRILGKLTMINKACLGRMVDAINTALRGSHGYTLPSLDYREQCGHSHRYLQACELLVSNRK